MSKGHARQAHIELDEHRATHSRLHGYEDRQSLVGLSEHCANSYIPHAQHIIRMVILKWYWCCGSIPRRV